MIIAVANQKGGVAKTTTAGALAAGLANRGFRVLAIDLDPQGNLSFHSDADENTPTIYNVLKKELSVQEVIQKKDKFDIIPANIQLAGIEVELTDVDRPFRLKKSIEPIVKNYDFIIIDTPPALGTLTVNAFTAADRLVVPTNAGSFSAQGIVKLAESIESVKEYCNPRLKISGILMTKHNPRVNISKSIHEVTQSIAKEIGTNVFSTYIRAGIAVEEAQALKQDLFSYAPRATVTEDYKNFIFEFLKSEGL